MENPLLFCVESHTSPFNSLINDPLLRRLCQVCSLISTCQRILRWLITVLSIFYQETFSRNYKARFVLILPSRWLWIKMNTMIVTLSPMQNVFEQELRLS
jgi:hypothetical protein